LDLPPELKRRGLHNAFHASLLRVPVPNDDGRFPGQQIHHLMTSIGSESKAWEVERILSHMGTGKDSEFELKWKSGEHE